MSLYIYNFEKEAKSLFTQYPALKTMGINRDRYFEVNGREFRNGFSDEDTRSWLIEEDLTMNEVKRVIKLLTAYRPFIGECVIRRNEDYVRCA